MSDRRKNTPPDETASEVPVEADDVDPEDVLPPDVGELGLEEDVDDEDEADEANEEAAEVIGAAVRGLPALSRRQLPDKLSALNVYLARLKDVEILPVEEQTRLAEAFQQEGDREAAARLVASNLRLVVKIAFQFRRQWADVMDLIAEGNLGLAEAIRKFDAGRGVPFPSYARFWIRARILAFIQENKHLIHAGSRAARKLFWRLDRERRKLQQEGIDPTPKLLADRVGVSADDVRELAPIQDQRHMSLDVPVHGDDEGGRTRGDTLTDEAYGDPESLTGGGELQEMLEEVFGRFRETLDERDRAIWDQRLQSDDPVRLEDLGNQFGVSKERVRQLEVRIKKNLKAFVQRELGDEVLVEALR